MIRFGEKKDISGLKRLWKECFEDEDAYIDAFFSAMYENEQVLLEEENGVLMGASFFLPGKIRMDHTAGSTSIWQEIRYVYALAVYPRFRGHGIAARLLHRAHERYQAPLLAEPAEEGLIRGFYQPLGFKEAFYLKKTQIKIPEQPYDLRAAELFPLQGRECKPHDACFYPVTAKEYCRIRQLRFWQHGFVSWPVRHAAFAIQEHESSGGGAFRICREGREEILLFYRQEQDLVVTETTLTEKELAELFLPWAAGSCGRLILMGVAEQTDASDTAIQARSVWQEQGMTVTEQKRCLIGMSYGMPPVYGYLNLSLD